MNPPMGKAKDYAPGEEQYPSRAKKTIYRDGYRSGLAGADAGHNPHSKAARSIWEAGRARGREEFDAGGGQSATNDEGR